ncbi:MAG TPA: DUF3365 domain-containing protein [Chthoniobacterales bacterium]
MNLLKFNLFFLPLLALCLGAIGYAANLVLQANARDQVTQNARIMMETALSSRAYTTKQVAPLLQHKNFKLESAIAEFRKTMDELPKAVDPAEADGMRASARKGFLLGQQRVLEIQQKLIDSVKDKPEELLDSEFHPQSVPAFAATEIFNYLREKFPDYFYKEATLNPTNPRNRSTDWETDVVNQFRGGAGQQAEFIGTRDTPNGKSLFLARPIKIGNVSCLQCHSTPDKAPPEMVKLYGTANGFGWKMDEIIGAQIVSVPMSLPVKMAETRFRGLLQWLAGAFVAIAACANGCMALASTGRRTP